MYNRKLDKCSCTKLALKQYFTLVLALSQKDSIITHRNRARKIPSKQWWPLMTEVEHVRATQIQNNLLALWNILFHLTSNLTELCTYSILVCPLVPSS